MSDKLIWIHGIIVNIRILSSENNNDNSDIVIVTYMNEWDNSDDRDNTW